MSSQLVAATAIRSDQSWLSKQGSTCFEETTELHGVAWATVLRDGIENFEGDRKLQMLKVDGVGNYNCKYSYKKIHESLCKYIARGGLGRVQFF